MNGNNMSQKKVFVSFDFDKDIKWAPKIDQVITVQIATLAIASQIIKTSNLKGENTITIRLSKPACIDNNMMIIISTKSNKSINIVGYGYLTPNNLPLVL